MLSRRASNNLIFERHLEVRRKRKWRFVRIGDSKFLKEKISAQTAEIRQKVISKMIYPPRGNQKSNKQIKKRDWCSKMKKSFAAFRADKTKCVRNEAKTEEFEV